jgi:hypothetical protein
MELVIVQGEASAEIVPGKASSPKRTWHNVRVKRRSYAIQGAARDALDRFLAKSQQRELAPLTTQYGHGNGEESIRRIDGDQQRLPRADMVSADQANLCQLARPDAFTRRSVNLPAGMPQPGSPETEQTAEPSIRTRFVHPLLVWPAGNLSEGALPRGRAELERGRSRTHTTRMVVAVLSGLLSREACEPVSIHD